MPAFISHFFSTYISHYEFLTELFLIEGLLLIHQERRFCFLLRLAISGGVCYFLAHCVSLYSFHDTLAMLNIMRYFLLLAFSLIGISFCWNIPGKMILFFGICAYAIQHCGNCIHIIITQALAWAGIFLPAPVSCLLPPLASFLLWVLIFYIHESDMDYTSWRPSLFVLSAVITSVTIILNYTRHLYLEPTRHLLHIAFCIYAFCGCLMGLMLLLGILQFSHLRQEFSLTEYLLQQLKKQYQMEKDSIDIINTKCHDMKHHLALLEEHPELLRSSSSFQEIKNAITIYDSFVKTGNDIIDTVLSQKFLLAEKHGITLTCAADDCPWDFMDPMDLYALFANLLDNAIESVLKISEKELRIINLYISQKQDMLTIHTQNYCAFPVTMVNGLPQTTKSDNIYHGYGLKSIRLLAKKYGGYITITTEENLFEVFVLIPQPQIFRRSENRSIP